MVVNSMIIEYQFLRPTAKELFAIVVSLEVRRLILSKLIMLLTSLSVGVAPLDLRHSINVQPQQPPFLDRGILLFRIVTFPIGQIHHSQ